MFERIVAAIDTDLERLNKIVNAAQELAQAHHSQVLVAHVRGVERPAAVVSTSGRPGALPPSAHLETDEQARALVDAAVTQLKDAGIDASGQVGEGIGSTARELLDIAQAYRATLIIVGDRNSRVTDLLLGGVAHRIVHLAECPVLLVR